jgi:hypothetical protein
MATTKKLSKKAREALIDAAFQRNSHGIQINVMDIGTVMDAIGRAIDTGTSLDEAAQAAFAKCRTN